jgi:SAM-dependent methyltransferase
MGTIFDAAGRDGTGFDEVDGTQQGSSFTSYLRQTDSDLVASKRQIRDLLPLKAGDRVLDVGCGTGADLVALAPRIGPNGSAIGVDNSASMIAEARRQVAGTDLPVAFREGDIQQLPFSDSLFDAARAERMLQHVPDPSRAVRELVRVVVPGGRVLLAEPDHGMWAPDVSHPEVTRAILTFWFDHITNPWIGRQLPNLLRQSGTEETGATLVPLVLTSLSVASSVTGLAMAAGRAAQAGVVTESEARNWDEELKERDAVGEFVLCGALVAAWGRVLPYRP